MDRFFPKNVPVQSYRIEMGGRNQEGEFVFLFKINIFFFKKYLERVYKLS